MPEDEYQILSGIFLKLFFIAGVTHIVCMPNRGGEASSQMRTITYKGGGRGSNFGDFCLYVLCEWPCTLHNFYVRMTWFEKFKYTVKDFGIFFF